jgi:hypothetical protein
VRWHEISSFRCCFGSGLHPRSGTKAPKQPTSSIAEPWAPPPASFKSRYRKCLGIHFAASLPLSSPRHSRSTLTTRQELIRVPASTGHVGLRKLGTITRERGRRFRCTLISARYEEEYLSEQPAKKKMLRDMPGSRRNCLFAISAVANLSDAQIAHNCGRSQGIHEGSRRCE